MTQVAGMEAPAIARVLLLADQSAHFAVAGLSQLERLLRTLEECFAAALDRAAAPEVLVFWKEPGLVAASPSKLPVRHLIANEPVALPPGGPALVLRTNVVFRRGALARLLQTPEAPFLTQGPLPASWEELDRAIPLALAPDFGWTLETPEAAPRVERELFRAMGKPTDGLVARTLNRPISRRVSRWLSQTSITPNQVSFFVLGLLTAGTIVLTLGSPLGFVVGMLLFHLASVLDGCDGELARAKFLETRRGAWLDTSVDLLGNFLLPMAIAVGLSRQAGLPVGLGNAYLLEGLLTSAGIAIGIVGVARVRPAGRADFNDFGSNAVSRFGVSQPLTAFLRGLVDLARRDSYVLMFVVFAVLGLPQLILHFLAVGIAIHLPVIAWSWWSNARVGRPLKAADRS